MEYLEWKGFFQDIGQDKGKRVADTVDHECKAEKRRKGRQNTDGRGNREARGLELFSTVANNHMKRFQSN